MKEIEELLDKIANGNLEDAIFARAEIMKRFDELEKFYKHTHKVEYVAGITRPYEQKIAELEAQIAELKDFAIWMTGCGYDFCQHEYFIKQRDVLLKV